MKILCIWAVFMCLSINAWAATPVKLLGVSLLGDDTGTEIALDLSAETSFTAGVHKDQVEIDLPQAEWAPEMLQRSTAQSGLILSWRRVAAAHGVKLVVQTATAVRIDNSASTATETGGTRLLIKLVRNDAPLPIAPPVAIEEVPVVTTPGAAFGPPLTPNTPAVPSHKDCVATTRQTGTYDGAPVYQYQDCK